MVRVLVDTCVLSEVQRSHGNGQVRSRLAELDPDQMFLSVITMGELTKGIALLEAGARKRTLSSWLLGLEQRYVDRILPIDTEVARMWGELTARGHRQGIAIPAADGLIAATALRNGLHVMTRNSRHFIATGAHVIDPWSEG